jgi:hypothetical protein
MNRTTGALTRHGDIQSSRGSRLTGNGRSKLNLGEQVVAWIQDVVAFFGNEDAGHGEHGPLAARPMCLQWTWLGQSAV